jgi:hypothetical protein
MKKNTEIKQLIISLAAPAYKGINIMGFCTCILGLQ